MLPEADCQAVLAFILSLQVEYKTLPPHSNEALKSLCRPVESSDFTAQQWVIGR